MIDDAYRRAARGLSPDVARTEAVRLATAATETLRPFSSRRAFSELDHVPVRVEDGELTETPGLVGERSVRVNHP